ncbi:MAG: macro domain-containing protein [Gemmatimonadota bacterium]
MIRVVRGDPIQVQADAFMRSIGADMEPCTAVDGILGTAAGPDVLDRLRSFGDFPVGGAVVTPAGGLGASFLIHVVIRSFEEPISTERIRRAFQNGVRQAAEWDLATIAVPPLGTGAGNLDAESSARIMCQVLDEHAREADFPSEVLILASGEYDREVFVREASRIFGPDSTLPR